MQSRRRTWRASRARTRRPTTSPPTAGPSVTTSSATPRSITTTSPGCRTPRATGCSRTQPTSAPRCSRLNSPPTPRRTCRASTPVPTRWPTRFPPTPTFWSSARQLSAFDVHLGLPKSGHRQHHGPVHGLRRLRRPDHHVQNRLRPPATTTVAVPGQRGRVDVGATGSAAERLELQQSHLQREPGQRLVATPIASHRQRTRGGGRCHRQRENRCTRCVGRRRFDIRLRRRGGQRQRDRRRRKRDFGSQATSQASKSVTSPTQPANPAALVGGDLPTSPWVPLLALLVVLSVPVVILSIKRKRGAASTRTGLGRSGPDRWPGRQPPSTTKVAQRLHHHMRSSRTSDEARYSSTHGPAPGRCHTPQDAGMVGALLVVLGLMGGLAVVLTGFLGARRGARRTQRPTTTTILTSRSP